jgi:hypothetical protein
MSALSPKADIDRRRCHVCFVPIADIGLLRLIRAFVKIERRFVLCIGQSEQDMTKAAIDWHVERETRSPSQASG